MLPAGSHSCALDARLEQQQLVNGCRVQAWQRHRWSSHGFPQSRRPRRRRSHGQPNRKSQKVPSQHPPRQRRRFGRGSGMCPRTRHIGLQALTLASRGPQQGPSMTDRQSNQFFISIEACDVVVGCRCSVCLHSYVSSVAAVQWACARAWLNKEVDARTLKLAKRSLRCRRRANN